MEVENLRSPSEEIGGIVYFGRMLDKIRLEAKGALPKEYRGNLGSGFDESCAKFLWIEYPELAARVGEGGTDEEILEWCFTRGRRPDAEEIKVWNAYMTKRGWRDAGSERLEQRKAESGMETRADIQTFFDYIDADEGRK